MGPGEHRPHNEEYWTAPWSTALFAGDLFEAIPFGDQPTTLYQADDGKHFVGEELRAAAWPPSRYDGDLYEVSRQ